VTENVNDLKTHYDFERGRRSMIDPIDSETLMNPICGKISEGAIIILSISTRSGTAYGGGHVLIDYNKYDIKTGKMQKTIYNSKSHYRADKFIVKPEYKLWH